MIPAISPISPELLPNVEATERFFTAALQAFERAQASCGRHERVVRVGREFWRWRFAGQPFLDRMFPACEHNESRENGGASAAWTVHFFDSATTGIPMPPPSWGRDHVRFGGTIVGFDRGRFRCFFQPGVDVLYALDLEKRIGFYWLPSLHRLPWWEPSFPLRMLLHWAYADAPWQPLHAGAVGLPEGGVLVAGPSGVGKSTTTLACLDSRLGYAGDDYVLAGFDPEPVVYGLYNTAKVEPHNLERLPFLSGWLENAARLDAEKAMVHVHRHRPEKMISHFPVRAIVLPRVTGERDSRCEPAAPVEAMHAIARTCMEHLPYHTDALLRKVGRLTRAVPVYRLLAGTDLSQIPHCLLEVIAAHS